jgi:hypothetical protein
VIHGNPVNSKGVNLAGEFNTAGYFFFTVP